jgi:transcriptional regulator with XRE-family HTH domain
MSEVHEIKLISSYELRARRLALNLTQVRLAQLVGCTNETINLYEKGKRKFVHRLINQRIIEVLEQEEAKQRESAA